MYLNRFLQWQKERFPWMNFISGFLLYLLPKSMFLLLLGSPKEAWSLRDLGLMLIPALHLFILRVFDEHKDFEGDKVHYPHRVLQKGIFKLKEVRNLGIAAFALQFLMFAVNLKTSCEALFFAIFWIWTLLMYKEFFMVKYLKSHFLLYGFLHLLVIPLLLIYLISTQWVEGTEPLAFGIVVLLSVFTGWIYELTRKTKAPTEETGDTSYSKLWGISLCCKIIFVSSISICGLAAWLFTALNILTPLLIAILCFLSLLQAANLFKFYQAPTPKGRKGNEGMSALFAAVAYLTPIIINLYRSFS